jgi:hypothetical protein
MSRSGAADTLLEIRTRWRWRVLYAAAVPAFGLLMLVGAGTILANARPIGPFEILVALLIVATLGGLIVLPGSVLLWRLARGVPTVRLDSTGIVWGGDRARDLAIDWSDVDAVHGRVVKSQGFADRVFVVQGASDRPTSSPRTIYARAITFVNRSMYGSPFAISTMTVDRSWEEIRGAIEGRIGDRLTVDEG